MLRVGIAAARAAQQEQAAGSNQQEQARLFLIRVPEVDPTHIPAWLFIVQNIMIDAVRGQIAQEMSQRVSHFSLGVNVFAHMGGTIGGLILIYFFLHPEVLAQRR